MPESRASHRPTGFVAYPSRPTELPDTIRAAVAQINREPHATLRTWQDLSVSGHLIINQICDAISDAQFFVADLTDINPNVLFEVGYAIAKGKPIWLLLDTSLSQKKFSELALLSTTGYSAYTNAEDIVRSFNREQPYAPERPALLGTLLPSDTSRKSSMLYIRALHNTESNRRISKRLQNIHSPTIVDDPTEAPNQTLTWYVRQVALAESVVCSLDHPERTGASTRNARTSLVAGVAHGFGKPLLMLAPQEFPVPLDYREILRAYSSSDDAVAKLEQWLAPIEATLRNDASVRRRQSDDHLQAMELRGLHLGEYIAENESDALVDNYFVETAAYREALSTGRQSLFVGRKGAGKTANMLQLEARLNSDRRNVVATIRPLSYELEGVVALLARLPDRDRKIYVVESLWKVLLYTEILNALKASIQTLPLSARTSEERRFIDDTAAWSALLDGDFAVRLENAVKMLSELDARRSEREAQDGIQGFRGEVSETIHLEMLSSMRDAIVSGSARKHRIALLVDNLDKSWDKNADLPALSEFLLGLLSGANRVRDDLAKCARRAQRQLDVSLAVFLRADIFERVRGVAREPDKLTYSRIEWKDPEMLYRIAEQRYMANQRSRGAPNKGTHGSEIWERHFCEEVRGLPPRAYIASVALPRPRDFLFFLKASIETAVNRGHARVEEEDILQAEQEYSHFACEVLLVEDTLGDTSLESVLLALVGGRSTLTHNELKHALVTAGVATTQVDSVIEQLCWLSLLQLETSSGAFSSVQSLAEFKKNMALARKLASTRSHGEIVYRIHAAFRAYLETIA
jgi:hypothetical protein